MKPKQVLLALTTLLFVLAGGILFLLAFGDDLLTSLVEDRVASHLHHTFAGSMLQQVPMEEGRRNRLLAILEEHDAESAKEFWTTLDPEVRMAIFMMSLAAYGREDVSVEEHFEERLRENLVRRWMFRSSLTEPEEDDAFLEDLLQDLTADDIRELDRRLAVELDEAGLPPAPWGKIADELERAVLVANK